MLLQSKSGEYSFEECRVREGLEKVWDSLHVIAPLRGRIQRSSHKGTPFTTIWLQRSKSSSDQVAHCTCVPWRRCCRDHFVVYTVRSAIGPPSLRIWRACCGRSRMRIEVCSLLRQTAVYMWSVILREEWKIHLLWNQLLTLRQWLMWRLPKHLQGAFQWTARPKNRLQPVLYYAE